MAVFYAELGLVSKKRIKGDRSGAKYQACCALVQHFARWERAAWQCGRVSCCAEQKGIIGIAGRRLGDIIRQVGWHRGGNAVH